MQATLGKTPQNPLTPSDLNQLLKKHLNQHFGSFWLTGEIIEIYQSPAGHAYFTLKDQHAGIKCVLFKNNQKSQLAKGKRITLLGQVTMYAPKGDLQVNALKVMHGGDGDREQQLLQLKQKLAVAGLFDLSKKQNIPKIINTLGIITSPNGAALKDILDVLIQKNPLIDVTIYPTQVQGESAAPMICDALRKADGNHDLLLLTRGGGSKEDLWIFNDEFIAYQIAQLSTPIISAIGHETDESISDLVADRSCITPTAAAHLIAGEFEQLKLSLQHKTKLMHLLTKEKIRMLQQKIDIATHQLINKHPEKTLDIKRQSIQQMKLQLQQSVKHCFNQKYNQFKLTSQNLLNQTPDLTQHINRLENLSENINRTIINQLDSSKNKIESAVIALNNQNPLNVLARGYSLTSTTKNQLIKNVNQVNIGDEITTQLNSGRIRSKIFERLEK